MPVTSTRLVTVQEFRQLPEDEGAVYHELRHGEIISVTRPKLRHALVQRNLRELLEELADQESYVDTEVAFRPLPEFELWVADVAYVSAERFANSDPDDNIRGAPDLVVEVLSPSNTAAEILEKERVCLSNGTEEFWVVDPKQKRVRVSTSKGTNDSYENGQEIPLPLFGNATLPVSAIFESKRGRTARY